MLSLASARSWVITAPSRLRSVATSAVVFFGRDPLVANVVSAAAVLAAPSRIPSAAIKAVRLTAMLFDPTARPPEVYTTIRGYVDLWSSAKIRCNHLTDKETAAMWGIRSGQISRRCGPCHAILRVPSIKDGGLPSVTAGPAERCRWLCPRKRRLHFGRSISPQAPLLARSVRRRRGATCQVVSARFRSRCGRPGCCRSTPHALPSCSSSASWRCCGSSSWSTQASTTS